MIILLPFHKYRFFAAEGLFGFVLLAAIGLDHLYSGISDMKKAVLCLGGVIILFSAVSPSIYIDYTGAHLRIFNSTLVNAVSAIPGRDQGMAQSIFFKRFYNKITAVVKRHSAPDDIIYSNLDYFAGAIGVLADRATSNAMLSEMRPYRRFDQPGAASVIVWLKDPEHVNEEPAELIRKYGLRKISDAELAFIYKNPNAREKMRIPRPLVPTGLLFLILLGSCGLIAIDFTLTIFRPTL